MKRVLTVATAGLFMTGLALLPMSVRADQTAAGAKDGKPVVSSTTTTTTVAPTVASPVAPVAPMGAAAQSTTHTTTAGHTTTGVMKKSDDKKVMVPGSGHSTVTVPGTTVPATGAVTVKPPVKGAS